MVLYNMMYGYGGFGIFWMIVFWAAITWLVIWVVKEITKNKEYGSEILEKRYVKGEIN